MDTPGHGPTCHHCTGMERVGKGEQTVTATRFAALTGVSRERLRTWERRYGFPEPHRTESGPRRYAVEDVQRVVAVRRAAEAGVPIPRAIERTRYDEAPAHLASHIFAALVEHAPVPVAALSGPAPLRVEFVNGALRTLSGAPRPGEELTTVLPAFYDSPCVLALQQLFATAGGPTETEHPAWGGDARQVARSALFRLPSEPDARPLVAMVGLEGEGERVARESAGRAAARGRGPAPARRASHALARRAGAGGRGVPPRARARGRRQRPRRGPAPHQRARRGGGLLRLGPARDAVVAPRPARVQPGHGLGASRAGALPARRRADVARRRRLVGDRRAARPARLGHPDRRRGRDAGPARLRLRRRRAPRRGQRPPAHGRLGRHGLRAAARPPGPGAARGRRARRARRTPWRWAVVRSCVPPAHPRRRLGPPSYGPPRRASPSAASGARWRRPAGARRTGG